MNSEKSRKETSLKETLQEEKLPETKLPETKLPTTGQAQKLVRTRLNKNRATGISAICLMGLICLILGWRIVLGEGGGSPFQAEPWRRTWNFLDSLVSQDSSAYAKSSNWRNLLRETLETLYMSIMGIVIAGAAVLILISQRQYRIVRWLQRLFYAITRTVPEVVWALLLVFVFKPGVAAAAMALAIHNIGVLGRLVSDLAPDEANGNTPANKTNKTNNTPANTQKSGGILRVAGASGRQQFFYFSLPRIAPGFLSYLLYRWEVMIRSTVIVGFIAGAGLGLHLRLALSNRFFSEVGLVLLAYLALVFAADYISAKLRRTIR